MLGIGTPPPDSSDSVLADMRAYAAEHPEDASFVWREHSAAGFRDHPVGCRHCWAVANPALGDFLYEDALAALLPPKTREATFRRARLCQFIAESDDPWLPPGAWGACEERRDLEDGAEVVLGFDGSYNGDCTAIVACTIPAASGERPHLAVVELWEAPQGERHWLVPILEVEEAIRAACRRFKVAEVVCDPFRWARSMQVLEGEGLPILEYPQSPQRMTPATTRFYEAVVNGALSHDGDPRLARHVGNAVLREDARGARIAKPDRHSKRRIDLAVAALMAHDRACQLAAADDDYDVLESVW